MTNEQQVINKLLDIIVYLYSCYFYHMESGVLDPEDIEEFKEEVENFSIYADREDFEPFEKIIRNFCEGKIGADDLIQKIQEG